MLSTPSRLRLLALLCLPLLSTACATRSTPASIARTERPTLPTTMAVAKLPDLSSSRRGVWIAAGIVLATVAGIIVWQMKSGQPSPPENRVDGLHRRLGAAVRIGWHLGLLHRSTRTIISTK